MLGDDHDPRIPIDVVNKKTKKNNEICFPSAHIATPYHNTPTLKSVPLNETIISKTFPSSKNSTSTVMMTKVKPRLIRA